METHGAIGPERNWAKASAPAAASMKKNPTA